MKINKQSLTPGEIFHLWIRHSGLTENQVGEMYGVSSRTIRNWEKDRSSTVPNVITELPEPLPAYTFCYILRKRTSLPTRQYCKTFGVDFRTLSNWENGHGDWHRLVKYFESLGWEFE